MYGERGSVEVLFVSKFIFREQTTQNGLQTENLHNLDLDRSGQIESTCKWVFVFRDGRLPG